MSEEQVYVDYFRRRVLPILLDESAGSSAIVFSATGAAASAGTASITFGALGRPYAVVSIRNTSLPAYTYNNLVEEASALSSSTEDAAYPLVNLYNRVKAHPFKFTTAGGYIEVDLGSAQAFNVVAIIGHDATALTGTVNAGSTPNPGTTIANVVYREEDLWVNAETTARYVRITLTGDITTIGELVIAEAALVPRNSRWGIEKGIDARGITHRTYGGVTWDYEHYAYRYLRPTFRFPESEYPTFELFSTRVQRHPFIWIPNAGEAVVYYVKKARGFKPQTVSPGKDSAVIAQWYDWTVDMEAESVGLTVMT